MKEIQYAVPIVGRNFTDPLMEIGTLTAEKAEDGPVAFQGKVRPLERKILKDREIMIATFIVTDHTSSIRCKAFLHYPFKSSENKDGKEDNPMINRKRLSDMNKIINIRGCRHVKCRGEIEFDPRLHCLTVVIRDLLEAEGLQ